MSLENGQEVLRHPASSGTNRERGELFSDNIMSENRSGQGTALTLCSRKALRSGQHGQREPLVAKSRNAPILVQGEGSPLAGPRVEAPSSAATSVFPSASLGSPWALRSAPSLASSCSAETSCTWTHPSRAPGLTRTPSHMALLIQIQERVNLAVIR